MNFFVIEKKNNNKEARVWYHHHLSVSVHIINVDLHSEIQQNIFNPTLPLIVAYLKIKTGDTNSLDFFFYKPELANKTLKVKQSQILKLTRNIATCL